MSRKPLQSHLALNELSGPPFSTCVNRSDEMAPSKLVLDLPDAQLYYWPNWLSLDQADTLWQTFLKLLPWQQRAIQIYGRQVMQPRLTCWIGDPGAAYTYSKTRHEPSAWIEPLWEVKQAVEVHCGARFNSVLGNYYRDGQDSMAWHSDNEPELGIRPMIASLSLGQERRFVLRRKEQTRVKYTLTLAHGSLLLMAGDTQKYWQHALPKSSKVHTGRINLTFRYVLPAG